MKVVRSARFGMRSLSLYSRSSVCARGGLFMRSRDRLVMCCKGMSMYLATWGMSAMASMSSSEK